MTKTVSLILSFVWYLSNTYTKIPEYRRRTPLKGERNAIQNYLIYSELGVLVASFQITFFSKHIIYFIQYTYNINGLWLGCSTPL